MLFERTELQRKKVAGSTVARRPVTGEASRRQGRMTGADAIPAGAENISLWSKQEALPQARWRRKDRREFDPRTSWCCSLTPPLCREQRRFAVASRNQRLVKHTHRCIPAIILATSASCSAPLRTSWSQRPLRMNPTGGSCSKTISQSTPWLRLI